KVLPRFLFPRCLQSPTLVALRRDPKNRSNLLRLFEPECKCRSIPGFATEATSGEKALLALALRFPVPARLGDRLPLSPLARAGPSLSHETLHQSSPTEIDFHRRPGNARIRQPIR